MRKELEAKFLSINPSKIIPLIESLGFVRVKDNALMRRCIFDIGTSGAWIRLRDEGNKTTLAYKQIVSDSLGGVEELETVVGSFEVIQSMLGKAGLAQRSYQENMRSEWIKDGTSITIDIWPGLDPYIEVEAETEEEVISTSQQLGFDYKSAFFLSSDYIYEQQKGIDHEIIRKTPIISFNQVPTKNNS